MVDCPGDIRVGNVFALRIGNRHERHLWKGAVKRKQVGQVLTAMQSRNRLGAEIAKQGHVISVDVEMQNIVMVRGSAKPVQHDHVVRHVIDYRGT